MPSWQFQFANFTSAFLWAAVLLAPGAFGLTMFKFMADI
jgi:membrane protein DedA with SNARE-associated domain